MESNIGGGGGGSPTGAKVLGGKCPGGKCPGGPGGSPTGKCPAGKRPRTRPITSAVVLSVANTIRHHRLVLPTCTGRIALPRI